MTWELSSPFDLLQDSENVRDEDAIKSDLERPVGNGGRRRDGRVHKTPKRIFGVHKTLISAHWDVQKKPSKNVQLLNALFDE